MSSQINGQLSSHNSNQLADQAPAGVVFWFRQDLRLHDQPALLQAIERAQAAGAWLLPVWVADPAQSAPTRWGFARTQHHRQRWQAMAVAGLQAELQALGSALLVLEGHPATVLADGVRQLSQGGGPVEVVCESIAAPEEQASVHALREAGVGVHTVWQSTLVAPQALPFAPEQVPDVFTQFRQALEKAGVQAAAPLPPPRQMPLLPPAHCLAGLKASNHVSAAPASSLSTAVVNQDARAAFPYLSLDFHGSERAALAHLHRYCQRGLPHTYKTTRNGLVGVDYSSKWSPWLATGALSARQAWAAIQAFEAEHGANDSTYWLWFELLWRDHFRWLHLKHGSRLYHTQGLAKPAPTPHHPQSFLLWCQGRTGHPFIDAGMRELAATGYLSNRMRQNVASYLIHDLRCDWRAGAAWFESQLLDFDVHSNQGNWLYLSGRGTDPRGSRRFNPDKQAQDHDPHGTYRQMWAEPSLS